MTKCPRNAFSSVRQWQDFALVRSRAAIRGSFFASCVPEGASDGKSAPSWQHIAAVHPKRAGFGKIFAPCIRKAPQTGVRGYTARRSCQEGALFAARAPQIMHGAQILPRPDDAEQRRGVRRTRYAAAPVAPVAPARCRSPSGTRGARRTRGGVFQLMLQDQLRFPAARANVEARRALAVVHWAESACHQHFVNAKSTAIFEHNNTRLKAAIPPEPRQHVHRFAVHAPHFAIFRPAVHVCILEQVFV